MKVLFSAPPASAPAVTVSDAPVSAGTGRFSLARRFIERPIAIVWMSGVMPQADTLEEYWDLTLKAISFPGGKGPQLVVDELKLLLAEVA